MKYILTILTAISLFSSLPSLVPENIKHAIKYPFAQTYYVSAAGSNSSNGTGELTPWQTLSKLSTAGLTAGDIVLLRRGDTWSEALPIPTAGITIGAYGVGSDPIITGLTSLTSWTNLGGNIWEASVNSGASLQMVTVNDQIARMGRFPNYNNTDGGFLSIDSYTYSNAGCPNGNPSCGTITDASLPGGTNWTGAEVVMRSVEWVLDRNIVTSHSAGSTTFDYTNPSTAAGPSNGKGYFFQNHVATLDAQNEWFYNPSGFTLRMYSTVNPATLNVKAATLQRIVDWNFYDNVTFTNLQFIGADEYCVRGWGGGADLVQNTTFENCTVKQAGVYGIRADGWENSSISYNTISDCNSIGIDFSNSGTMVVNFNNIKRIGLIAGAALSGNQQHDGMRWEDARTGITTINNNRIDSVGYCGVYFHGSGTIVRYNHITNFNLTVSDGGGIYSNGDNPALYRFVEFNTVLHGIGNSFGTTHVGTPGGSIGIYMDDFSRKVYIQNNTIGYCSRNGILLHQSQDIIVRNNIIINGNESGILFVQDGFGEANGIATRNITFTNNTIIGEAGKWLIENGSVNNDFHLQFTVADSNYFGRPGGGTIITTNWGNGQGGTSYADYTFSLWRSTFPAYEVHSSFTSLPDVSQTRLEYNTLSTQSVLSLPGVYKDIAGNTYNGSITLAPYSSKYLIYESALQPGNINSIPIKGRIVIVGP